MNETREKLLLLSRQKDISAMGLRELARELSVKNPQTIKFHLSRLSEDGLLKFDIQPGVKVDRDILGSSLLIRIPIKGTVSAGPATELAEERINGYLRISSALLKTKNYKDLYALRVRGTSMNRASVNGLPINNGDYAIIDSSKLSPKNGDYVIAAVDDLVNIKKFYDDKDNKQIVLLSESSEDYLPIFVHPEDDNGSLIRGSVVQVVRQPVIT